MTTITYEQYVEFCKTFQEEGYFDFDEREIELPTAEQPYHAYDGTYRDPGNYKTNARICYDGARIWWEIEWSDGDKELSDLYARMFLRPTVRGPSEVVALARLQEAMIDIAIHAGALIAAEKIEVGDSRHLVQVIQQLAMEFELSRRARIGDYLISIERFAEKKLTAYYQDKDKLIALGVL